VFSLDRIYTRGFRCVTSFSPRGPAWARMSDHLPLLADLVPE
jgi:endonuclease/exonuclease/phosphatase family metal-dependent hydrolase